MKEKLSEKELALFQAVIDLIEEDADIHSIKVSDITNRAGIGKGTAYEYFSSKEEMVAKAIIWSGEQRVGSHRLYFKLDHFMGCRYGLFAYSTAKTGGSAEFYDFASPFLYTSRPLRLVIYYTSVICKN